MDTCEFFIGKKMHDNSMLIGGDNKVVYVLLHQRTFFF